ncbi:Rho guanine nucleotide exchange factor scd1 [Fusarium pseudoanthophilum]|uniref:Rho guanine nucleotide exchange factor scd1 n=1 Tax=Fusarium pseudoanthophilum TaxID=48495 RepID=A0A8H5UP86_9HYPO|nr:Rho guanine nucleotide exchange factor scd1 [Fusarium pseudoanthophilum]
MSDPLSVAASIAGLISITVEAVKFLSPYVSAAKETPQVAAHVYSEVQSTQVILMGLQSLTKNLGSVTIRYAALIGVNQVVAILTDGVLLYSELHKELQSLWTKDAVGKVPLRGRLQWVWKESTFVTLLNRLQSFKSSMTLILMILQSDSGQRAKEHQEQLSNNVKVLLDSNEALSRRLMNVEDALDDQTIVSRRMSILSLSASPSQNTSQQSTAESPATSVSTDTSLSISKFDFEGDLESSRVYRRAVRETMDFSFRSSIARSHNWSVFSGLSLGDISIMSVIALPVYQDDISNFEHYDSGEEVSMTPETPESIIDQPLLMQCLELKLKLLTKPGMQKYFDKTPFLADDFFYIWAVLREAMPLVILARALEPTPDLDIDSGEELTVDSRKELVLWFAQFCHDILEIKTSDLITVQDLMGNRSYGFLRTISLLLNITQSLPVTGSLTNDWSLAKARVNAQPPKLRSLLTKQRQLVRDLDELLQMNAEFEVYMKPTFENFRQPANVQILFLLHLEANLLRPPVEHKWAPAFQYLLQNINIEALSHAADRSARNRISLWLKAEQFRYKDKIILLLTRCLDILPTSSGRISALFSFSEYLKSQPISSEAQREDISSAQSCISKIVTKLHAEIKSKDTQTGIQGLQQKIQDWKGIIPDDLGELILSKTIYVTKSSKTYLYHAYLFQNMFLLCKEVRGEHAGDRLFYRTKSLSERKQTKFLLKGRFHLRHILSATPISHHGVSRSIPDSCQLLMQADKHICEVQWSAGDEGIRSSFSLVFAVESEMREWASKIDEYRMMAILMARPKNDAEEMDSLVKGNK